MRQIKITERITKRDSKSLNKYLVDISPLAMVTAEEEVDLCKRIQAGDMKALSTLVEANVRFVVSVAKQYSGDRLEDLIAAGNEGLIKAATRFDATKGFKFISYAVWWIRQSITEHISMNSRSIRIPLNKQGLYNKFRKAASKLEQELEREPSLEEVIDKLAAEETEFKMTNTSARDLFTGFAYTSSLDAKIGGAESEGTNTMLDVIASEPDSYNVDVKLRKESLNRDLITLMRNKLDENEFRVLAGYYGFFGNDPQTLNELSLVMDKTPERIRQYKAKAERILRHPANAKHLRDYLGSR